MDKIDKKGNILLLTLLIIFTTITFGIVFILGIQINKEVNIFKSDLFYILQNAYLAVDKEELAYSNYIVDDELLKEKILTLIRLNHPNKVYTVNEVKYIKSTNNVYIDIVIYIQPVAMKDILGNITVQIKENVKLKLMEVN